MHISNIIRIFVVSNQTNNTIMANSTSNQIKVLIKNESPSYSSESVLYKERKYKIVAENGNSYSHLSVYVYNQDGEISKIANEYDVPNYYPVSYVNSDDARTSGNCRNINAAEIYITKIF